MLLDFFFFSFLVKLGSEDFYCLTRYAGMFSTEKSELEKEGNNCFADEFYVSYLREREVFQGSQVKLLGDYASFV